MHVTYSVPKKAHGRSVLALIISHGNRALHPTCDHCIPCFALVSVEQAVGMHSRTCVEPQSTIEA
eukprot:6460632-Amphidinium_carterae.1